MLGFQAALIALPHPISDALAQLIYPCAPYSQVALAMLIDHTFLGLKLTFALLLIQFGLFVLLLEPVGFSQPQSIPLLGEPNREDTFESLLIVQLFLQDLVTLPAIGDRLQ